MWQAMQSKGQTIARGLNRLMAAALVMASATPAWAQPPSLQGREPRYVLSYVLIVLWLGLALFLICRPGKRGRELG